MENKAKDSVRVRLEKLRIVREKEIPFQEQKMESFADSFCKAVESINVRSRANALSQGEPSISSIYSGMNSVRNFFLLLLWSVQHCNRY